MQTKPHLKSIKIGLGCMPLSGCYGATAESHAVNVIQKAYDLGVCYFDTADNYGDHKNEEILGKAIKTFKNHVFISSKIGVKSLMAK